MYIWLRPRNRCNNFFYIIKINFFKTQDYAINRVWKKIRKFEIRIIRKWKYKYIISKHIERIIVFYRLRNYNWWINRTKLKLNF